MQKIFTFSRKTIISRWGESAIINCEDDQEFIRLVKNQKYIINKIIKIISRKGEKRTTLYQPGYYRRSKNES